MSRAINAGSATTAVANKLTRSCRELWIRNDAGSAAALRVRVQNRADDDPIHDDDEYRELAAGEEQIYAATVENPIEAVYAYTGSGTATFSMEVLHP